MRLMKLSEHLLQQDVKLPVTFDGGGPGRVSFAHFVPINSAHRGFEMFLLHRSPDDFKSLLSNVVGSFAEGDGEGRDRGLRRLPNLRPRSAEEEHYGQRE